VREILFRAKRKATNDWVYGYFEKAYDDFQIYVSPKIITKYGSEYVREDTLGQFTGLTDKNGTKIFEGDIVEYEGKRYSINYLPHYARFSAVKPNTVFCVFAYQRGEVIGNIYDNPELMKGDGNDT
jgi:uncharacterized phage protein (TIGR01671 family)